jgi:hypothetical protein
MDHNRSLFSDITVELAAGDDPVVINLENLILEISSNGDVANTVKLSPRESVSGLWDANQTLVM